MSTALAELYINLILAFGGPRPASLGLTELFEALQAAIQTFVDSGGIGPNIVVPPTSGNAAPNIGLTILPTGETLPSASIGTGRSWGEVIGMNAGQGGLLVTYTSTNDELFVLVPPGSGSFTVTLAGNTTAPIPVAGSPADLALATQVAVQALGPAYSVVNVYLTPTFGQIIMTTGNLGVPTASGATITAKLALNAFEVIDQLGNLIFTVGDLVTSYAGLYVGLGTLVDTLHQAGWWSDVSGGAGTHGYTFFNKWGSAPFDVGGQPQFHGNGLSVLGLAPPTLSAFASSASSTLTPGTYYYVATAVNNAGKETVVGNEVSITTTTPNPAVQLAAHQSWGMAHPNFYRGTVSGGPYQLIGSGTETPQSHGNVAASVGLLDTGLTGTTAPPTAPTPAATTLQGWTGEPGTNLAFRILTSTGNLSFGIDRQGDATCFGAQLEAATLVGGSNTALDGTTNPPSILMAGRSYGAGNRLWTFAGTPSFWWVAGTTQVGDLWYNSVNQVMYQCIVSGAGTGPGTWIQWGGVAQVNVQTGSNYTITLNDIGQLIEMNNASANTLTIPPNASVACPQGSVFEVTQVNSGVTTVTAGAGVTINSVGGLVMAQYVTVSLRYRGGDVWLLTGATT